MYYINPPFLVSRGKCNLLLAPCSKLQAKENEAKRRRWKWEKEGEEEVQARGDVRQNKVDNPN
jgi:hypothetical protein